MQKIQMKKLSPCYGNIKNKRIHHSFGSVYLACSNNRRLFPFYRDHYFPNFVSKVFITKNK